MNASEAEENGIETGHAKMVSITVPGEIEFRGLITRTVAAVCKFAWPREGGEAFTNEILSAVGEAFNNAIIHSYADTTGDVCLTVSYDALHVQVELVDTGAAFDPDEVPTLSGNEPQESGMGLFIIRSFVDQMYYCPGPPNRLRMTKRLPKA